VSGLAPTSRPRPAVRADSSQAREAISDTVAQEKVDDPAAKTQGNILALPREFPLDFYYKRLNDGLERYGWKVSQFTCRRALINRYRILHIHFPELLVGNPLKVVDALRRVVIICCLLVIARVRRSKIVWSLHNLVSHEQFHPWLESVFLRWLSAQVSMSIHMSHVGWLAACKRYPLLERRPSVVIPLMHFGDNYVNLPSFVEARRQLGLACDLRVILFLGQIRKYKNVPDLIRTFSALSERDLRLFIVGQPIDATLEDEVRAAASDQRIALYLQTASINAVKTYMAAASLVVAPYSEMLNSGSALLALTHNRPILLPNRGALAELQSIVGKDWVRIYEPPLTPETLSDALAWAGCTRPPAPDLRHFSPEPIVERHHIVFSNLLRRRPVSAPQYRDDVGNGLN
jgi:beta-1,4-mannosyltransferase